MKKNYFETILGTFILILSISFLLFFLNTNSINNDSEMINYKAKFLKIGGVIVGNDVKLRGVKIGTVTNVELDKEYFAVLEMALNNYIKLPVDSIVEIQSEGLLGNKYLSIIPGDNRSGVLASGDYIEKTRDFESIEDQVSRIIFLATQ